MSTEPHNPFSKSAQVKHSPGGRGTMAERRGELKSNQSKGAAFETSVQAELQRGSAAKVRRNHQGRVGGGLSNPDIAYAHGWHVEVKDEKTIRFRDYVKQVLEDCPKGHKPAIVMNVDGTPWLSIKLEDRKNFAASEIEAEGGEVYFP